MPPANSLHDDLKATQSYLSLDKKSELKAMFKTANVGNTDRVIRLIAGIVLIALPFINTWSSAGAKWLAIIVGVVLIATALVRFCPMYRIIGANTCGDTSQS